MESLIRELSEETVKVRFYKVDFDAQHEISKFVGGIHIIPTIFVYKSGATVNTMAGANPKGLRVCHSSPITPLPLSVVAHFAPFSRSSRTWLRNSPPTRRRPIPSTILVDSPTPIPSPTHAHHHPQSLGLACLSHFIAGSSRLVSPHSTTHHPPSPSYISTLPPHFRQYSTRPTFSFHSYPGFRFGLQYLISRAVCDLSYIVYSPPASAHAPAIPRALPQPMDFSHSNSINTRTTITRSTDGRRARTVSLIYFGTPSPFPPLRLMHFPPFLCLDCLLVRLSTTPPIGSYLPSPNTSCWYLVIDMHPHSFSF